MSSWLTGEELEEKNPDLLGYLHGFCNVWVDSNFIPGDRILVLIQYDYDRGRNCLLHCLLIRDGKYVDIRGETSNFDYVLDDFDWGSYRSFECSSLKAFHKLLNSIGFDYD